MRRFYLKTALIDEQINEINKIKDKIDGVEIQLLNFEDDLEKIFEINVPIVSIHYYSLREKNTKGYLDTNCSLEMITSTDEKLDHFEKVCRYASEACAEIVVHLNSRLEHLNYDNLKKMVHIASDNRVPLLIENVGLKTEQGYVSNLEDLDEAIEGLRIIGLDCQMLIDTCHVKISSWLNNRDPYEEIKYYIQLASEDTETNSIYLHLSDAKGDGVKENHAISFLRSDLKYLDVIMKELGKTEKDINLILEINDINIIKKPLARELKKYIEENY